MRTTTESLSTIAKSLTTGERDDSYAGVVSQMHFTRQVFKQYGLTAALNQLAKITV